jgi:manganese transport protein
VFFSRGKVVTEIQQAHELLEPLLGTTLAPILFAVALLCSGLSSTMTGTMAGQIVMEGFLNIRLRPWLRRLLTRLLAITPAALTIYIAGEQGTFRLLILSQVILSMQLPFAVIPLIHFTSDRKRMGAFTSRGWLQALAWIVAAVIVVLNVRLVVMTLGEWLAAAGRYRWLISVLVVPVVAALALMLAWVFLEPWLPGWLRRKALRPLAAPSPLPTELHKPLYRRILVPLDHTIRDSEAVSHATAMAKSYRAKLHLLHVEEGVTSEVYGPLSSTAEVQAGRQYLEEIAASLRGQGIEVETAVVHSQHPSQEIARYAREIGADLLVMGAHGHKGLQDLIFGTTIDAVRHVLDVPILVVRAEKSAGSD